MSALRRCRGLLVVLMLRGVVLPWSGPQRLSHSHEKSVTLITRVLASLSSLTCLGSRTWGPLCKTGLKLPPRLAITLLLWICRLHFVPCRMATNPSQCGVLPPQSGPETRTQGREGRSDTGKGEKPGRGVLSRRSPLWARELRSPEKPCRPTTEN